MSEKETEKRERPFIKLFRSPRQFYLFSVNRDRVVQISQHVYDYLYNGKEEVLLPEDREELETLEKEGYLSAKHVSQIKHPELDHVEEVLDTRMEHLILQVTQSCNLTCGYCPYANVTDGKFQRNHSSRRMNFETARQAVDFFLEHSCDRTKNVISFYGGEPLIAFSLIRDVVNYAKRQFAGKDLAFNMTTNATLFTDEMMDFMAENRFRVVFSIDGPARIHDKNRRHTNGSGSFQVAFANLKKLVGKYGDDAEKYISLNMVFDPNDDLDEIISLFEDPLFDRKWNVMGDVADDTQLERSIRATEDFRAKMNYQYFLEYLDFLGIIDGIKTPPFLKNGFAGMEKECADLRKGIESLPDVGAPSGPCIPGQRSLFVNADGDFYPCEKVSEVSEAMKIGSMDTGFDYDKARAMLDIGNLTPEKCKNCWAFHHCQACARVADEDGCLSGEQKMRYCYQTLNHLEDLVLDDILIKESRTIYMRGELE